MREITALACLLALAVGCSTISPTAKEGLAAPVDCDTAEQDIATLEAESASVAKQVASGVRSVLPAAVVGGILQRDYRNRVKVASGQYNRDLETKIAEIRAECGIPAPE